MTDEELIARLREDVFYGDERLHNMSRHNPLHMEAADRIEALVKERDEATAGMFAWVKKAEKDAARAERLEAALRELHHAVCGETGFAACVRLDSGKAYPWPALDEADAAARAALTEAHKDRTDG